ncbi:hypothetical protein KFU94_11025 [Chloroflexi bacterium TSY]|nr:hypothetical protein [Chloroflexi bacterium TSY]
MLQRLSAYSVILICIFVGLIWGSQTTTSVVHAGIPTCGQGTVPANCFYLPLLAKTSGNVSNAVYDPIPIMGEPIDRPAATNGDINLSLRSYVPTTATLALIDIGGAVDQDAPQLADMFIPPRVPTFTAAYQMHEWDWQCSEQGCRGAPISDPTVTLIGMETTLGEPIHIPSRRPDIFGGIYRAMVLYAEETRITLVYLRDDTPAFGYVVHIEDVNIDANLLALYREMNRAGRTRLPALRNQERLGNATGTSIKVAIRDNGSFMDPRSRKDWWMGW